MKYMAWVVAGWMVLAGNANADVIQFDISPLVEKDLVYESGGGANAFGDHGGANQSYLEDGYNGGNGLPSGGVLASSQAGLGNYQLLGYDGNNAMEFAAGSAAANEMLSVDTSGYSYSQIGLLIAGVNGDVSFTYTLNYADASSETFWWEADDWYDEGVDLRGNMHVIASGMDNANVGDGTINDLNHFSLFEFVITPSDTTKEIVSVQVGNNPNRWSASGDGYGAVFAMNGNGQVIPEPSVAAFLGIAVVGLWTFRRNRRQA